MKKVAVVTGASAGIGKETSKILADKGYTVYGVARRTEKMSEFKSLGIHVIEMDVSDESSIVEGINRVIREQGRIDVLVNNAGFGLYGAIEDVPMADARYQMEVNLFGLARLVQLVLPHMRQQRFGKIVNVTSIGGKVAGPLGGWYHASKFAVEGLSDSLRLEVKPFGIDVILIEPGGVKTEWGGIAFDSAKKMSGETAYRELAEKAGRVFARTADKNMEATEIGVMIQRAIEEENPRARYVKGYLAKPILFAKKWISDGLFDKMIISQLK